MDEDFVIVGTAGHIDHGKSALVSALTGVATDRMKEEKERGISIDIGFAPLLLPSGKRLGLVDVPGHERFIRNMLAGAGGIDLILLVIDAREGVMPQTREHLAILQLLDISVGLVVITKIDLVDEEWLHLVHDEVASDLAGTFLEGAPMLDVSAVTKQGLPELLNTIESVLPKVRRKPRNGPLRMPIDRVFSVQGFGTVVTGTIWRGGISVGDLLDLFPSNERVRVRSIQVHGQAVELAVAGQRTAVALSGVRSPVHRGMSIGAADTYETTRLLDVRVRVLPDASMNLAHRMRVRLYIGTSEVVGRVLLIGTQEIAHGEEGLAQILLEQDVLAEARDRFVLRSYSPMHTIGGGAVIDPHPQRLHRRHSEVVKDQMLRRERGTPAERLYELVMTHGVVQGRQIQEFATRLGESSDVVEAALSDMLNHGMLVALPGDDAFVPAKKVGQFAQIVSDALKEHFQKNKFDVWVSKSVALQALRDHSVDHKYADLMLNLVARDAGVDIARDRVRLTDRTVELSVPEKEIRDRILRELLEHRFDPPSVSDMEAWYKGREKVVRNMLHLLEQEGLIASVAPDLRFAASSLDEAEGVLRALRDELGQFTVAAFRDRVKTSRKFAVALLEYMDRQKKTRRNGDVREYIV